MKLALMPQPHSIRMGNGWFRRPARGTVVIRLNRKLKPGGYRLRIGAKGVMLEAESPAAAFHGAQTLFQIASQSPAGRLPFLDINDRPDFAVRGIYYDISRGRVPKLEELMKLADQLSRYKINQLQLYIEHTFLFRNHPDIGRNASPLTADDILRLDRFCRERHIELVPSLACFGHLSNVLKHPRYRSLAEDWGKGRYIAPEADKLSAWQKPTAWSLSPANPKVYEFLDSLFAEFLPLFSSNRFNICCDETWDLGLGQSYELCRKRGKGRVYLNHILELRKLARKYGKRIMFWGDIIRKYPELIPDIPKDVTVLDWGYNYNHDFNAIADFKKAGTSFYGCPGTSSWVSLFPRLHEAQANIAGFARAAKRHNADGLLITDWGDNGHYNFMEYSWPGFLFGGEQAWNVKADKSRFTRRFCKLFLNIENADIVKALDKLGDITHLNFGGHYQSIWQHIFFAAPKDAVFRKTEDFAFVSESGVICRRKMKLDAKLGRKTLAELQRVKKTLQCHTGKRGVDPMGVLPYWLFAVDTLTHAARKQTVLGEGGRDTLTARRTLRAEMTKLMKRFETLWMARNRRSEIRITLARYRKAIRSLK